MGRRNSTECVRTVVFSRTCYERDAQPSHTSDRWPNPRLDSLDRSGKICMVAHVIRWEPYDLRDVHHLTNTYRVGSVLSYTDPAQYVRTPDTGSIVDGLYDLHDLHDQYRDLCEV